MPSCNSRCDDDLADFFVSDPDDVPVGSISPRIGTAPAEPAILTLPDDNCLDNEPAGERDAIASQITAPEPQLEKVAGHDEDDIDITGPAAKRIPAVAAAASRSKTMMRPANNASEGGVDGLLAREHSAEVNQRK